MAPSSARVALGARLRAWRLSLGLARQADAAAAVGVPQQRWSGWERGAVTLPAEELARIARILAPNDPGAAARLLSE